MLDRRLFLAGSSAALIAGAAPRSAWGRTEADVIVIGAGLAGLFAAHRLEVAGLRVVIVEAERRVGGRLHTLDDVPGTPEAGGIQVGSGYTRLRAIADDLGVPIVDSASEPRTALYAIGGKTLSEADWPTSPVNRLAAAEKRLPPAALGGFFAAKLPALGSTEAWMQTPTLDVSYAAKLAELGASDEARRLIEANLNGNTLAGLSTLHIARSAAIFRAQPGPVSTIGGGSQRLPEAMAKRLRGDVRLGQIVTAIAERADGVIVTLAGGRQVRARHAICTIPFAALRHVPIEAHLDPAIATI